MQVSKDEVAHLLRARGEFDKAAHVECALPKIVDTTQDAGVLHQFDVSVAELQERPPAEPTR